MHALIMPLNGIYTHVLHYTVTPIRVKCRALAASIIKHL